MSQNKTSTGELNNAAASCMKAAEECQKMADGKGATTAATAWKAVGLAMQDVAAALKTLGESQ